MNMNPHNRISCGAYYPESPIIGRFVSPWDTSGWYSVYANFGVGAKLHSNENVTAAKVPARYVGADYIMTFNSQADGFDDKQEVDFFFHRRCSASLILFYGSEQLFIPLPGIVETGNGLHQFFNGKIRHAVADHQNIFHIYGPLLFVQVQVLWYIIS